MRTIEIGRSGVRASQVALGVMRMDALAPEQAAEVVRTVTERGVNFFDTADIYGFTAGANHASSAVFGRAWRDAGLRREDIVIQTKFGIVRDCDPVAGTSGTAGASAAAAEKHGPCYDFSAARLIASLDEELEALGTDYVDFVLLHRPDTLMEAEEVCEAFRTLHDAGKVRHFGVSNMGPWQVELLRSWLGDDPAYRLEANQLQFGLGHAQLVADGLMVDSIAAGTLPANHADGLLEYSRLRHMTIQAWSPMQSDSGQGPYVGNPSFPGLNDVLEEKAARYGTSADAIATAWILRHPAGIQAVLGSMTPARLNRMIDGADVELDRRDWWDLLAAAGHIVP